LEHCNETFALLDTNAKGYLNAQDIVNLSQKVSSTDTSGSNARTGGVSLPYAEQMLQHLTFTPQSPRQAAPTVGTASTSMLTTATTAAQMSRTEFYRFMSPKVAAAPR
jgi:hypothetical protein